MGWNFFLEKSGMSRALIMRRGKLGGLLSGGADCRSLLWFVCRVNSKKHIQGQILLNGLTFEAYTARGALG